MPEAGPPAVPHGDTPDHPPDGRSRGAVRPAVGGSSEVEVRGFGPWLAVLAVVLLLSALRLRTLAALVSLTWLAWCVWTWIRPRRHDRPS